MPDAGYLTIGKVVRRLSPQYPDLSISKVRYLEDEGLLNPARTPGGYRLFSPKDVKRLETILYLQKTRFMPLSVIREKLDHPDTTTSVAMDNLMAANAASQVDTDLADKLHPLETIPDLLGVPVSFVRQLEQVGVIEFKRSPHGRDLVDGHDFALIQAAMGLGRYGLGPKNLRQYVIAANRESTTFEQALGALRKRAETNKEDRREFATAFNNMLMLTNVVSDALIRRKVLGRADAMGDDGMGENDTSADA